MSEEDDPAEEGGGDPETGETTGDDQPTPEEFGARLDEATEKLETAETESDLDDVEALLDSIGSDLEAATLPEPDDDDEDGPREALEDRLSDLSDDLEEKRGPYVEDVTDELDGVTTTITTNELTEEGVAEVATAIDEFLDTANDTLPEPFAREAETAEELAEELDEIAAEIGETDLHPDDDADEIETLLDAAETLSTAVEDAQVFGDLEVREQLRRQGFYDVIEPKNRKDFPPEWTAIKIYESQGEPEPILEAMEQLDSDFMEENILDALEHFAPEEAFDQVHQLAQRRNIQPVRILGRIGDERACDTLVDFLGGGDVKLEKTSLRALGAIGSEETTEAVAQRLDADNSEVRSAAARALGLIGDTRAIEPLADVLAEDDADEVRASAAWALRQIGTEAALETATEYTDDRAYIVQAEAEHAATALPELAAE